MSRIFQIIEWKEMVRKETFICRRRGWTRSDVYTNNTREVYNARLYLSNLILVPKLTQNRELGILPIHI